MDIRQYDYETFTTYLMIGIISTHFNKLFYPSIFFFHPFNLTGQETFQVNEHEIIIIIQIMETYKLKS